MWLRRLQTTSWAQQKKGGKFKLFVKKNEAKIFKRALEAEIAKRELKLFKKNCSLVSRLLRYKWLFCPWVRLCFPSVPVEQFNSPFSLEEILHFCGYLKILCKREKMVLVKLVAHDEYFQVNIIEFLSSVFWKSLIWSKILVSNPVCTTTRPHHFLKVFFHLISWTFDV